jgi:hypothetical protein
MTGANACVVGDEEMQWFDPIEGRDDLGSGAD